MTYLMDSLKSYLTDLFLKNLRKKVTSNRKNNRFELHATDLIKNFCSRRVAYSYLVGKKIWKEKQEYATKTYLTFALGNKIEELAREMLNGVKPPAMIIKIGEIYIVGSPDILVKGRYLIECKSISRDGFLRLIEPIPEHVHQLQCYLWMASKLTSTKVDCKQGAIIYVPKEEVEETIKIFEIRGDPKIWKKFERITEELKRLVERKILPDRQCSSPRSKLSLECREVDRCWNATDVD